MVAVHLTIAHEQDLFETHVCIMGHNPISNFQIKCRLIPWQFGGKPSELWVEPKVWGIMLCSEGTTGHKEESHPFMMVF